MDHHLERYLNDHLAGSKGAVILIQDLIDRHEDEDARNFFTDLKSKVEEDRLLLKNLLHDARLDQSSLLQAAGSLTARASRIKLMWEGMNPGELGIFEALEMLALGIQGKRILWVMLNEISPHFPEWDGMDFTALEFEAIEQRDSVERYRIQAGREALASPQRRLAAQR